MYYPVRVIKKSTSEYEAEALDLSGCLSCGRTTEDAIHLVTANIETHLAQLVEDNRPLPVPQSIEYHQDRTGVTEGAWVLVSIDLSKLSLKPKRVNISIPERLLKAFDAYAEKHGLTRSGLLAQATSEYINLH